MPKTKLRIGRVHAGITKRKNWPYNGKNKAQRLAVHNGFCGMQMRVKTGGFR